MKKIKTAFTVTLLIGSIVMTLVTGCSDSSSVSINQNAPEESISTFKVHFSDAALLDLRKRLLKTRWPERETVKDRSQRVRLEKIKALVNYWANDYDWRKVEAKLNSLPQFKTKIDGLEIHFIHVRSPHKNALPMKKIFPMSGVRLAT